MTCHLWDLKNTDRCVSCIFLHLLQFVKDDITLLKNAANIMKQHLLLTLSKMTKGLHSKLLQLETILWGFGTKLLAYKSRISLRLRQRNGRLDIFHPSTHAPIVTLGAYPEAQFHGGSSLSRKVQNLPPPDTSSSSSRGTPRSS